MVFKIEDNDNIKRTIMALFKIYNDDKDKSGLPGYLHPIGAMGLLNLPKNLDDKSIEMCMICTLLHDCKEDYGLEPKELLTSIGLTGYTEAEIDYMVQALELLTNTAHILTTTATNAFDVALMKKQAYRTYVDTILASNNDIAVFAKTADMLHNMTRPTYRLTEQQVKSLSAKYKAVCDNVFTEAQTRLNDYKKTSFVTNE